MGDHTPGPWNVEGCTVGQYRIRAKQGPLDVCPATVYSQSDAYLIAAAPELLAACKDIVFTINTLGIDSFSDAPDLLRTAVAAIAKAEGNAARADPE